MYLLILGSFVRYFEIYIIVKTHIIITVDNVHFLSGIHPKQPLLFASRKIIFHRVNGFPNYDFDFILSPCFICCISAMPNCSIFLLIHIADFIKILSFSIIVS